MATTCHRKLRPLLRKKPIIRTRDLARLGLPRTALETPLADGALSRLSRGVYAVTGHAVSEYHSLAQAAVRVPNGVVCLLSALMFHGLTTQSPHEVWLAIDRNTPFRLVLSLLDTPTAGSSGVLEIKMPKLAKVSCP